MAVDLLVDIADIIAEPVAGSVSIRPAGGQVLRRADGQAVAPVYATAAIGTGGSPTSVIFPDVPTSDDTLLHVDSRGYALEVTVTLRRAPRTRGSVERTPVRRLVSVAGTGTVNWLDLEDVQPVAQTGYTTLSELVAEFEASIAPLAAAASASAADAQTALQAQFLTQDEGVATLIEDEGAGPLTRAALDANYSPRAQVASGIVDRRRDLSLTQSAPKPTGGRVLVSHAPTALAQITTTSVSYVDVDPALKARVVCPPSGRIHYRLHAHGATGGANTQGRWALAVDGILIQSTRTTAVTATTAAPVPATPVTLEGVVDATSADGTVKMVPGKEYTIAWQHASGTAGSSFRTEFGGFVGPAVMDLTPVQVTVTDTPHAATVSAVGAPVPMWLCHDRTTLLGSAATPWRVRWSTDDGQTWTAHPGPSFPQAILAIREADDGEILVFVASPGGGVGATVWRSTGWAADHATATFAKVLESTGPSRATNAGTWRDFGIHVYGPVVLVAEYGTKNGPSDMARYLYMSEDHGATWRTIFDLADYETTDAHLHGVAYDPWWDAIWLSSGDDLAGIKGEVSGNWVSFDRGATWTRIAGFTHQTTAIVVLPSCILWTTDIGGPNCIYRIPRVDRSAIRAEVAYLIDPATQLTAYGTSVFQSRSIAGAPALFPLQSTNVVGSGRLLATYDGYHFKTMWTDTATYANRGLFGAFGPTVSGAVVCHLNRGSTSGTPLSESEVLTLRP